jgi:phage-related protein (TIGR01555 family)
MDTQKPSEAPSSSSDRVRRFRERKRKGNEPATQRISPSAIRLALEGPVERVHYPIRIPVIPKGVAPQGVTPQVAMDSEPAYECARLAMDAGPQFGSQFYAYSNIEGFPGYPYLMLLALRSEYRNMATALATELTRKWIKFNSTDTEGESTKTKITEIEQKFTELGIQGIIRKAAEHDAFYGTGQVLINIKGADLKTPLIIDQRTVKKGSLIGFKNVDPIWTTPLMYNSLTPSSPNFYRPDSWWVMGEHWDESRVIVTVTREVPDIFKPAFNFSGMSLSQLAEPYVNNWLRTRQSVSDLINNFSVLVLKTAMDQVLTGGDDGSNLFSRIKLFTATRSNKGVMVLDKDREELEQIAVPLGGLHELQSQALEQLCVVSREPATVLTGITPSGFGNVAEGEVRIWYDYIHAQQEAHWRGPIDKMFKIVQMSMYGEIDPEITFEFVPLYEMTEEQESTIRVNDSIRAGNLIDRGVIDAQEERERLARDPESGYQGIDISKEIAPPDEAEEGANLARGTDSALGMDADFVESEHPRDIEPLMPFWQERK